MDGPVRVGVGGSRVPALTNGALYSIRLRAVNAKGAGAASTAVSARPSATVVVPGAPTYLSARSGSTGTTAIMSFWPGADGGAAISNYQYSINLGTWKSLSPADATSPITIPGRSPGTTYSIRIRAVNAKGAGAISAAVSVTTLPPAGNCSPSYPTVCIPPPPPDLDCGDIPHRRFTVLAPDPHRFDSDSDGIGCES